MRSRQPLPRLWLMTDERMGEALWDALAAEAEADVEHDPGGDELR